MAVKCKVPGCNSYTNHADGLCGFHYRKAAELAAARDAEQLAPEEEERARLGAARTFESFTAGGSGGQEAFVQRCDENYAHLRLQVAQAVEASSVAEVSREAWDMLRRTQEALKQTRPLRREQRDELWQLLQQGFENEKRKKEVRRLEWEERQREREKKQREWEERKQRWSENAAALEPYIREAEQEASSSTDWHSVRETLKQLQQRCREYELSRDDRNTFFGRLQNAFDVLGRRQTEEREQYERACAENYRELYREVAAACEDARCGSDFNRAFEGLKRVQQGLRGTRPTKKEDRDALFGQLQDGFSVLKERREEYERQRQREREERQREHERRKREWQERQRDKISRLKDAISRLEESVRRDSDHLADLKRKHDNVRPGRKAMDIYATLNRKMEEVANRRWDKMRKSDEMKKELTRMEDELYHSS